MVAIMKPVDEAIEKEVEAAFQGNAGSSSSAASASLTFASLRGPHYPLLFDTPNLVQLSHFIFRRFERSR